MGLLAQAIGVGAYRSSVEWDDVSLDGPLDPRWYDSDLVGGSVSGVAVTARTALNCGTVLAALRFVANSGAMCQSKVYRELPGNQKEEDREHYLHALLRRPNTWQNGYRWRHQQLIWLGMWGNSYNRIVLSGGERWVDELRPLHPSRVRVLDQAADGTLVYGYQNPDARREERIGHDRMLHFRGLSLDGVQGEATYRLLRNVVGIAIAAERHVATFLRKGTRLSGVLSSPNTLTKEQKEELYDSWSKGFGGGSGVGSVAVLQRDWKFQPISPDNVKAQMLELRDFQVGEILRMLGVPGVVVGWAEKTATYASAKEFFESGGIKHCILPWIINMEEEIDSTLISSSDSHYVKFNLDVLLRSDIKTRYEAMYRATGGPWKTRNEARRMDDLNPLPDPDMDRVLTPSNMAGDFEEEPPGTASAPPPPRRPSAPEPPPDGEEEDDEEAAARMARVARRAQDLALEAAGRVVRREIAAIQGRGGTRGAAVRFASDPAAWAEWLNGYYQKHARHVAETLRMPEEAAARYAEAQRRSLLAEGVAVVETWPDVIVPQLAALALEDGTDA